VVDRCQWIALRRRVLHTPPIEHESRGHTILLFGREDKRANDLSAPFYFLGPARYVSHSGSRPISSTWRPDHALPAKLLRRMARLAVG
jgi:hypothetical protein